MDTLIGVALGLVVSAFFPQVPTWVHNKVIGFFTPVKSNNGE